MLDVKKLLTKMLADLLSIFRRPNDMKVTAPNITGVRPTLPTGTYAGYGYWYVIGKWK